MIVYLYETGVLLPKDDPEYENYNMAYGGKFGFYDTDQYYVESVSECVDIAMRQIQSGELCQNGYIVVSETVVDDSRLAYSKLQELPIENETYDPENIKKSWLMRNGVLIEDFTGREDIEITGLPDNAI